MLIRVKFPSAGTSSTTLPSASLTTTEVSVTPGDSTVHSRQAGLGYTNSFGLNSCTCSIPVQASTFTAKLLRPTQLLLSVPCTVKLSAPVVVGRYNRLLPDNMPCG